MRVHVDKMVCEANGTCERIAPQVFRLDDEDELEILQPEVPAEFEEAVRSSVDRCPKMALRLTD